MHEEARIFDLTVCEFRVLMQQCFEADRQKTWDINHPGDAAYRQTKQLEDFRLSQDYLLGGKNKY